MYRYLKLATPLVFLAILFAGCGDQTYKDVTEQSIVDLDLDRNLLGNPGFEDKALLPWEMLAPQKATIKVTDSVAHRGEHSLEVIVPQPSPKATVSIFQFVSSLPIRSVGAQYRLTFWIRTHGLSENVPVSVRLTYADGSYEFEGYSTGGKPAVIPIGSSDWTKLDVLAKGTAKLSDITVFPTDSRADFNGTFWIDDVRLSAVP